MQLCVDGSAKIAFNTDGNSFFNGGNVGIGTDSPSAKVHLYDSGSSNINLGIQNSTRYYKFEVDSGSLLFFDVSAYEERMRINSSGQLLVGIQTINTNTARMHVDANTANKFCTTISHNGNTTNRFLANKAIKKGFNQLIDKILLIAAIRQTIAPWYYTPRV